jgi:hypothetical protein
MAPGDGPNAEALKSRWQASKSALVLAVWELSPPTARSLELLDGGGEVIDLQLRCGAMQDLAQWLEKLGLSENAQPFAENGIDFGVLPDLTDQDHIGVLFGHRRKLLRAIAELNEVETGPLCSSQLEKASHEPIVWTRSPFIAGSLRHATAC